jgi:hypothetical protein
MRRFCTKTFLHILNEKIQTPQFQQNDSRRSRLDDISNDFENQFSKMLNKCVNYSLAFDKSTDVTSSAQMYMFAPYYVLFGNIIWDYPSFGHS